MLYVIGFAIVGLIGFAIGRVVGAVDIDEDAKPPYKGTLFDSNLNSAGHRKAKS